MILDLQKLQNEVSETRQLVQSIREYLDQLAKPSTPIEERPVRVKEVAAFLNKTEATVYGLVYEKKIPHHKPDGTGNLYFFLSELSEWVKNGRKATNGELEEQARQHIATRLDRRKQSKSRKEGYKAA
ncbi:helix-turn-helix domain-containing protein [Spirosoma sp. HMF4905]|uniref:Helix-turn-helix domain-containing protein n=1 Tax=Spirosoma arboris TaxID=2682092 RepID=A0A7K1SJW6_9BACT|nr:helix-turn-helix domain-containing protein [Spirosoma arboris]MVM34028.1 helix-turn-helix domain-containing protein [Spirosoma arboris]